MKKRYQYWGFKDGKAQMLWTNWFSWDGEQFKYQLKPRLLNEYTD